jgi:hypothetical protein
VKPGDLVKVNDYILEDALSQSPSLRALYEKRIGLVLKIDPPDTIIEGDDVEAVWILWHDDPLPEVEYIDGLDIVCEA